MENSIDKQLSGKRFVLFQSSNSVLGAKFAAQICEAVPGIELEKVDIEKEKDLASQMNIRVSPILFVYQDGNLINSYTYSQKDDLICFLKS